MFDYNFDKIKKIVLITILSVSMFKLILLVFPTLTYIVVILGILIPMYFLYKSKKLRLKVIKVDIFGLNIYIELIRAYSLIYQLNEYV